MSLPITEAAGRYNDLLPRGRLLHSPSPEFIQAAAEWSQAVWAEAERLGPMLLSDEQIGNGLRLAAKPIFICGVHRSGTTLVKDLLDGHPELTVLPSEGTYFTNFEAKLKLLKDEQRLKFLGTEWLRRFANPINQPPYWLLGPADEQNLAYVNFARYLMTWWDNVDKSNSQWPHQAVVLAYASCTKRLPAKYWVDKTPANEQFLKRIWNEMPGAKVIQIIRDPVAILASRKKMEIVFDLKRVIRDMRMSFHTAAEHMDDPRFLLIRYEDLCANTAKITKEIAGFLDIEYGTMLTEPTVAGQPSRANSSFNTDVKPGQIITSSRQEDVLTNAEIRSLKAGMGKIATFFGYPIGQLSFFNSLLYRAKSRFI